MSIIPVAEGFASEVARRIKQDRYKDDPVLWSREYLGINLWSKQREILYSIRDNRNTAVAAGHGVGKSFVAAIAVAWWVDTHPVEKTFVATTAPSSSQLGIIWDNLRRMYNLAEQRYKDGLVDHKLPGYITGDHKWKADDGSLIGEGRAPRVETIDAAFQGRHADYLLAVGDEAVGLSQGHLDALGNIATGPANRQVLFANPTNPGSAMAGLWDDRITLWTRMHISVFDSPAIKPDPEFTLTPDMSLSGMDYVDQMREQWGEDHPIYIARVTGQWAFDAANLVFSPENLAAAQDTVVVPDDDVFPEHGWDISGDGPDFTVGYELRRGQVWTIDNVGKPLKPTGKPGYHIRRIGKWNKKPLVTMDPNKPSTASKIHELAIERAAKAVKVDSDGIGISVINGIASIEPFYELYEYRGGMNPLFSDGSYVNSRAEMYFLLRDDMVLGRIDLDPKDEKLFTELSGIQYDEDNKGRLKIESKKEMKSRGMKSPDHADACMYARFPLEVLDVGPPAGTEVIVDPWDYADEEDGFEWGSPGHPM